MTPVRPRERGSAALVAVLLFLVVAGVAAFLLLGVPAPPRAVTTPAVAPAPDSPDSPPPTPAIDPRADSAPEPTPVTPSADAPAATDLPGAPEIRGRVLAPDGTPIEGASIRILAEAGRPSIHFLLGEEVLFVPAEPAEPREMAARLLSAPRTTTDGSGEFSIPAPSAPAANGRLSGELATRASLLVSAPGHAPAVQEILPPGRPGELFTARSRSNAAGSAGLRAEVESAIARTRAIVDRLDAGDASAQEQPLEIRLEPATRISGRVVSSADGRPAVGVDVVVGGAGGMAALIGGMMGDEPRARVGPDGRYAILVAEPGEARVGARSGASDFAPLPSDRWVRLVIARGDVEHFADLAVDPGGAIEGRLVTAEGHPIAGGEIQIFPDLDVMGLSSAAALGELEPRRVESDASGAFRAGGLALGRAYRLTARADEFAGASAVSEPLDASRPDAWLEIVLQRGSTISGVVVDEGGTPLAGIPVRLLPDLSQLMRDGFGAMGSSFVMPVTSVEDGAFAIEHIAAGKYRVVAGESAWESNPFEDRGGVAVEVDGIEDVTGLLVVADTVVEPEAAGDLAGRVVDGAGNPLAGATVVLGGDLPRSGGPVSSESPPEGEVRGAAARLSEGDEATLTIVTDVAGRFSAPGMAAAGVTLDVSYPGHDRETVLLDGTQTELEIVLEAVGIIRGRVTVADGSAPPVPFRVAAEPVGDAESGIQASVMRMMGDGEIDGERGRDDGTFEIDDVRVGVVEVVARAPGYAPARSRPIEVRAGTLVEGVDLVLTHGASVTGIVRDPAGTPLGGAKVICLSAAEASGFGDMMSQLMPALFAGSTGVVTGADGTYEIANLEPGEYQIRATHSAFARSEAVTISLRPEEEADAPPISLLPGGIIEGIVLRAGEPVPGIMIQAFSEGSLKQGMTDAAGAYRFDNLPEGEFSLIFMNLAGMMRPGGGSSIRSRTVQVVPGETVRADLEFGTGRTVSGVVEPVPPGAMRMVTLRRPGGPAPEELNPLDMTAQAQNSRYQVGLAMLGPDGKFSIEDIEPGEYILEVPAMPDDPTDMQAYAEMDRTPHHRSTIRVGESDLDLRVRLDR